ncbi:nucleotidyltransferase domain-containing protein [uncultured Jatrophihabitans sp.]|uniref:nucleotidyltransferase domain-containing protein n=1 Tax=uncultured Jatrophihabitans sp. TaxID=1610747 RepID=UPI0035CBAF09
MQLDRPLAVITSSVDGDVLTAMAHRRAVRSTAGQLQYYLKRHSVEGIRRSLKRLEEQGVVQSRRSGNTHAYVLNREHLATAAIVELASQRERFVECLAIEFAKWQTPPAYAALFGSTVSDAMRPQDEINLFIAYADGIQRELDEQIDVLAQNIRAWTGNRANIATMADGEAARRTDDELLLTVRWNGQCVYGSSSWVEYQFLQARELARSGELPAD